MASEGSARTVAFAISANVGIAALKFIAAAVTMSSAILAEAIHSLVDTVDGVLLYVGLRRGRLVFAVGGGMSVYEGITHLMEPRRLSHPIWSYAVLLGSMLFEGTSWAVAWRPFKRERAGRGIWKTIEESKDPTPSPSCSKTPPRCWASWSRPRA